MENDSSESVLDILASRGQDDLLDRIARLRTELDGWKKAAGEWKRLCHEHDRRTAARYKDSDNMRAQRDEAQAMLDSTADRCTSTEDRLGEVLAEVERLRTGLGEAREMAVDLQLAWEIGQNRHTDGSPHQCPDPQCDEYIGPLSDPEHAEGCRYVALSELAGEDR